jgi:hypothetical protein
MHSTGKSKLFIVLFVIVFAGMFILEARPAASKSAQPYSPSPKGEVHEE